MCYPSVWLGFMGHLGSFMAGAIICTVLWY